MTPLIDRIGARALAGFTTLLEISALPYAAAKAAFVERGKSRSLVVRDATAQLYYTGVQPFGLFLTLGVMCGVVVFAIAGRVLAATAFASFVPEVVARAVVFEIVPLVVALVLVGRSGTAISTELGYMRVNREVEALEAAGINLEYFLVLPRMVGVTLAAVCLTLLTSIGGLVGGWFSCRVLRLVGSELTLAGVLGAIPLELLAYAMLKSALSGVAIAAVNCHFGLTVGSSAREIPVANVRGAVRCYVVCFLVNTLISLLVLLRGAA
jgi:phospholipid/cholesterol/gamma-HCH transport system permease protein